MISTDSRELGNNHPESTAVKRSYADGFHCQRGYSHGRQPRIASRPDRNEGGGDGQNLGRHGKALANVERWK